MSFIPIYREIISTNFSWLCVLHILYYFHFAVCTRSEKKMMEIWSCLLPFFEGPRFDNLLFSCFASYILVAYLFIIAIEPNLPRSTYWCFQNWFNNCSISFAKHLHRSTYNQKLKNRNYSQKTKCPPNKKWKRTSL